MSNTVLPNQINIFAFHVVWISFGASRNPAKRFFPLSFVDDADSYRDRLKVLRMRAGLDNSANTESKVCVHLFTAFNVQHSAIFMDILLSSVEYSENGKGRPACP